MVIKRLLIENLRDWHAQLEYALWANRVRVNKSLGTSPYLLVYNQEPVFPLNLKILVLKFMRGYVKNVDK